VVLIETIGVGQDEVEVARVAPVTVLVLTPGSGDDVQAIKAGILEIADVYVVNKAEGPEAERVVRHLMGLFSLVDEPHRPIVKTVALRGEGIEELAGTIEERGRELEEDDSLASWRREKVERRLQLLLRDRLQRELASLPGGIAPLVEKVLAGDMDPHAAAAELWAKRLR
jgi:LAO/AO transport system kinase